MPLLDVVYVKSRQRGRGDLLERRVLGVLVEGFVGVLLVLHGIEAQRLPHVQHLLQQQGAKFAR